VIVKVAPGPGAPVLYAPAAALGLDLVPGAGRGSDDLDALILVENGIAGYQPSTSPFLPFPDWCRTDEPPDMLLFSVRRGSAVIGAPDSIWGAPIAAGDVLVPPVPGGASPFPGIYYPAESLGLTTVVRGGPAPTKYPYDDDLDALDNSPDCNRNGYPDSMDIARGVSSDLNFNGIPDECESLCNRPPQDFDGDNDVDGADFGSFAACFNGSGGSIPPPCLCFDSDGDGDVDGVDYGVFSSCFNGSGNPPNC